MVRRHDPNAARVLSLLSFVRSRNTLPNNNLSAPVPFLSSAARCLNCGGSPTLGGRAATQRAQYPIRLLWHYHDLNERVPEPTAIRDGEPYAVCAR